MFGRAGDQPLDAQIARRASTPSARRSPGDRRPARPGAGRRRVHRDRRREHGQCDQADLVVARLRRHRVRPESVRRRRRPDACAVADALGIVRGAHPSAGRRAFRLRHRPGRHAWPCAAGRGGRLDRRGLIGRQAAAPLAAGARAKVARGRRQGAAAAITAERRVHRATRAPTAELRSLPAGRSGRRPPRSRPSTPGGSPSSCPARRSWPRRSPWKSTGTAHDADTHRPFGHAGRGTPSRWRLRMFSGRNPGPRTTCSSGPPGPARRSRPGHHRRASWPPPWSSPAGRPWSPTGATCGCAASPPARPRRRPPAADPVTLELFNSLFMAVAEPMGAALERTAHSVNIKERLDFSCALFDADGGLVANAPHMPVHLGSMGASVKTVTRSPAPHAARRRLRAEQSLRRRHPPAGHHRGHAGVRAGGAATGLLRRRARPPRRVGGIQPGSMPPPSRTIEEEGVLLDDWLLVRERPAPRGGDHARCRDRRAPRRANPEHQPGRPEGPDRRQRDGRRTSCAMIEHFGRTSSTPTWATSRRTPSRAVRRAIGRPAGRPVRMRAGQRRAGQVAVRDHRRGPDAAQVDFTGTSAQLADNFNAPTAWPWRPCCTCSAPWSTTTSRSTPAACSR